MIPTDLNQSHILVVDDTPENQIILKKILSKQGYQVELASNGEMALQMVKEPAPLPDLILLDIMMPGINGYEVCRQLKADERTHEIPVIFMSSLTETAEKVAAFDAGGIDYILKPFQTKEVLARIHTHLKLRQLQKRLQEDNEELQQEIAQRNEAERSLRASEKRLRSIFNHVPFGIFHAGRDGRLHFANPALAMMLGYSSIQELLQHVTNIAEQVYVEPRHWYEMIDLLQGAEEQTRIETKCRDKEGAEMVVMLTVWAVRNDEGELLYFEGTLENITERKRIEDAIQKQLSVMDEVFTGIHEGIAFVDDEETVIFCNPGCAAIFEEPIETFIGKNFLEFFDADAQAIIRQETEQRRQGKTSSYELTFTTPQGTPKELQITATPRFGKDGRYLGAFGTCTDITGRKHTEALLHRLKKAAETTEVGMIMTDLDRRIVYANPAAAKMHGYTVAELAGQPTNIFTLSEFQESDVISDDGGDLAHLLELPPERIHLRKDQSLFPVKVTSDPIKDANGIQLGYVMICEDITDRKQAEDALLRQTSLLRGVAGAMNSLLVTPDLRSAFTNALETLGLAIGLDRIVLFENHLHPDTKEPLMSQRMTWSQSGFDVQINLPEFQNIAYLGVGLRRWYETLSRNHAIVELTTDAPPSERAMLEREGILSVLATPIIIRNRFWGFLRFDHCQTERHWTEEEQSSLQALAGSVGGMIAQQETESKLISANNELTATLQRLTQTRNQLDTQRFELNQMNVGTSKFFTVVAQDLRKPFAELFGVTSMILKQSDKLREDDLKKQAISLRNSARTISTLMENLLILSRLQSGVMEHHPDQIALDEIAAQNLLLFKSAADQKQIIVMNQIPKGTRIRADRQMLDLAIRNLIAHAMKFTNQGGIVAIAAAAQGDRIELSLSNTGVGIPKEEILKLFQPGARYGQTGMAGDEETGLGLLVCKELIEKNGGTISVESEIEQGTVFTVSLPIQ